MLGFLIYLGELGRLVGEVFDSFFKGKIRGRIVLEQLVETGFRSQSVVMLTGAFTGAVLAAQAFLPSLPKPA